MKLLIALVLVLFPVVSFADGVTITILNPSPSVITITSSTSPGVTISRVGDNQASVVVPGLRIIQGVLPSESRILTY
jgi:hypothetical protein